MHRDIRPKNMLVMSVDPPRAALCDYGKAIEAEKSDVTTIGPIYTLAPEVWSVSRDGPYTAKIDVWAYGYAIAEILGYTIAKYPGLDGYRSNNPKITRNRHSAILEMLRAHGEKVIEDQPLVDLCLKLLAWKPNDRWSASQALEHPCWSPIVQEQEQQGGHHGTTEENPSRAKRTQLSDPRQKPNGESFRPRYMLGPSVRRTTDETLEIPAPSIDDDTQEFSQGTFDRILKRNG